MFSRDYPNIAQWVEAHGWVEIGDSSDWAKGPFVRAFNLGGQVFEGEDDYLSLEAALEALDAGIAAWLEEHG